MKILDVIFRPKAESTNYEFTILGEFMKDSLTNSQTFYIVRDGFINKLVAEIYPDIKNKLMENNEFQKIINEVRLLVAKEFIK